MSSIYLLRISLIDLDPPVWLHALVSGDVTLSRLHEILQVVMGWEDSHLWHFTVGGDRMGLPDFDSPDIRDARRIRLHALKVTKGSSFGYTYDYGDDWKHEIVVEAVEELRPEMRYPFCIGGRRACPPEDCGGAGGYEELLEAVNDSDNEGHADARDWLGDDFDPEYFSAEEVNEELEELGFRKPAGKNTPQAKR